MIDGEPKESSVKPESAPNRYLEYSDRGRMRFRPLRRIVAGFGLLSIIAGLSLCASQDIFN